MTRALSLLGWGLSGAAFGMLVRSGLLSDSEGAAFTLVLTAPAFVVGVLHPPSAASRGALREWVLHVVLVPVVGVALFGLGYAVTLGFPAAFTSAMLIRHLLFATAYVTAFIAYYIRNPQPYRRENLFVTYIVATLLVVLFATLGRVVHSMISGDRGLMETLAPISEGAATLPLAAVNLWRSRKASFR